MIPGLRQSLTIGILMLCAGVGGVILRPVAEVNGAAGQVDLESIVPRRFGEWRVDDSLLPLVVSPDVKEKLDLVYDRSLSRIYVDDHGEKVILLLAYGRVQAGGDLQLHRPEGCYAAQGFLIGQMTPDSIVLGEKTIPIMRVVAVKGRRTERITHWARVGDRFVRGYFDQALARLSFGLQGSRPDGLLFRVSTLDQDAAHAAGNQDRFIRDLMAAIPADRRTVLIGRSQ